MGLMKKILISALCVFLLFIFTGCESSSSERDALFQQMKKQKIISKDYELVEVAEKYSPGIETCKRENYYIYEGSNSNIIAITYEKNISKWGNYDHEIVIYFNVIKNQNLNYLAPDSEEIDCWNNTYYKYSNGDITDESKYALEGYRKPYYVTIKKSMFSTKYIFDESY